MKPLIKPFGLTDPSTLEDLLLCMAANVEDSLLQAGATPGKDYTILDLYKLAQPFALHTFTAPEADVTFSTAWTRVD